MKRSIAHLPKRKQDDIYFLVKKILEKLPQTTMIILYGSYARGNYVEYDERVEFGIRTSYRSDYDILVVTHGITDREAGSKLDNVDDIYSKLSEYQTPVQFINDDINKLNSDLSEGRYFYTEIKRDGILLYDSGKHKLARRRKLHYDEIKQQAEEYYNEKYEKARQFFETRKYHYDQGWLHLSAFDLHQTCENLFYTTRLTFTLQNSKQHNLAKLLGSVRKYSPVFSEIFPNDTAEEKRLFKLLKTAYVEARYNPNFKVTEEDFEALSGKAILLFELVERICRERLNEYEQKYIMESPAMMDIIKKGDEEIKNGGGTSVDIEDLWK